MDNTDSGYFSVGQIWIEGERALKSKSRSALNTFSVLLALLLAIALPSVSWARANFAFSMSAPASTAVGEDAEYTFTVTYLGDSEYQASAWATVNLPTNATLIRSSSDSPLRNGFFKCSQIGAKLNCEGFQGFLFLAPQESLVFHAVLRFTSTADCAPINVTARFEPAPLPAVEAGPVKTTLTGCQKAFHVSLNVDPHGTVSPNVSQTVPAGQTLRLVATPDAGYDAAFEGCGPFTIGNTYTTKEISSDCTVSVHFSPIDNIVTPTASAHAAISPAAPIKLSDYGKAEFRLTADQGYTIFSSSDCSGSSMQRSQDMSMTYIVSQTKSNCTVSAVAKPNLILTATPNPAVYGSLVTLTATLTDANPPGKVNMMNSIFGMPEPVQFRCDAVAVVNREAKCTLDTTKIHATFGTYGIDITAAYDQSTKFPYRDGTVSNTYVRFVFSTATELGEIKPAVVGQNVFLTAGLSATLPKENNDKPTGTITIRDENDGIACTYSLAASKPGCTLVPSGSGNKLLTASYSGDEQFVASVSASKLLPVAKADSRMAVSSSKSVAFVGEPITFSASVRGYSPKGTLNFSDGGTPICASVPLVSQGNTATASCTVPSLTTGQHAIAVSYAGDANNVSTSAALTQSIVSLTAQTKTVLSSSWNPATQGQAVTLIATVTGSAPSGSVDFVDASTHAIVCTNAPLVVKNGASQAFCRLPADNEATLRSFTAKYRGDGANESSESEALTEKYTVATDFSPNRAGLTGSWYNPATSGQGLLLQIFPNQLGDGKGQLFAGWFTYAGGSSGSATWYTLQGEVNDNGSTSLSIFQGTGGLFDTAVPINIRVVGTATLKFADCGHGTLSYTFTDDSARSGQMPLQRLTQDSTCNNTIGDGKVDDALLSGAWYDPGKSGQGFVFDVAPGQNLVFGAWYTYSKLASTEDDAAGGRRWYTIQSGGYVPGTREANNVPIFAAWGGAFDDPTQISSQQVGTVDIRFNSCSSISLNYRFTAGENNGLSGSISLKPVGPMPQDCH